MQALITGGAGFIGSALTRALLARGDRVRIFDNLSSGRRENLHGLDVELVVGDILDGATLTRALAGVECVFHLAALVSVPQSFADPERDLRSNIAGTLSVLQAARGAGVARLVYSSSAAIYGDNSNLPLSESALAAPLSPYGVSKLAGEFYVRMFHAALGMETVALRYFNVYGPRQDPRSPYSGVLSRFLAAVAGGVAPAIFGDGQQTRDFVYVDDVARANLLASAAPVAGRVFNIGGGRAVNLLDVIQTVAAVTGRPCQPVHHPVRAGDIRHSAADISAARRDLGFDPVWSLEAGLAQTWDWAQALTPERLAAG